jgi:predicted AAA+ superfamily ATPase
LLVLGGFPEPLFAANEAKAKRWSRLRLERLLTEDVRDLRAVEDLSGLRVLADLLPDRVGSLLSMNALREDVGVAYGTIRSWIQVFIALYHCFLVKPYARRIARAIRAAPKLYLFDGLRIPADRTGARQENLTACRSNDTEPSPALTYFQQALRVSQSIQLVTRTGYDRMYAQKRIRVTSYEQFLAGLV